MNILNDYTFQIVTLGSALLGGVSGVLGCFAVLRKQSLLGDGISHSALAGVVLAFILSGSNKTEILLLGGLITGLISTVLILIITNNSRIKFDSALAMIMSVFFGLGLVLLTYVQKQDNATQAGLERFIYGQAAAILQSDVKLIAFSGGFLLLIIFIFWKEFKLISFDIEFAKTIGIPTEKYSYLLTLLIIITIIIGLQTVGAILMSAMLVTPAIGARMWVNSLSKMVILSAILGTTSAIFGTIISSTISNIPTGPAIVIVASIITMISINLAKK